MKKITVLIQGTETTVELQDSILTTRNDYVFVKKATVFSEYRNITERFIAAGRTQGESIYMDPGYYTFDDIKDLITVGSVSLSSRKFDGKCEISNGGKSDFLLSKRICDLLV